MIVSAFASFVFILMSYKVHAIDQYQNVLPNYDLSDGRQQLNGELSRPNNRDYMPGRQQAVGNNNVGAKVDYQLKLNAQRLQRQQALANQQQERNRVCKYLEDCGVAGVSSCWKSCFKSWVGRKSRLTGPSFFLYLHQ